MVLVARITGALAAIIWFVGAPLVAFAGVPFPSDTEDLVMGAMAVLLGFTLAPVTLAIGGRVPSLKKTFVRLSGLAVCIALIASGVALILAVDGRLGVGVTRLVPDTVVVVFLALFGWISMASYALRGPSTIERSTLWLGLTAGASCVVPVLAAVMMFYFAKDFVFTNATVVPLLLIDVLLWVSLPVWLTAVLVGLS